MIRHTILAAVLALCVAGAASAEVLKPVQARDIDAQGIDLGAVSGVVYYTAEPDGFRVVATLALQGEDAVPVRVEAILAPGQSVVLSTPHGVGEAPETVQISRQADTVLVHKATAAAIN
jgi:hypothetical protein